MAGPEILDGLKVDSQASKDRSVLPVGHGVIVLVPDPQEWGLPCGQKSSVTKWRNCTLLGAKLQEQAHEAKVEGPLKIFTALTGLYVSVDGVVASTCCCPVLTAANK